MKTEKEGERQEVDERKPPRKQKPSLVVRVFRVFRRHHHRKVRYTQKDKSQHQVNERTMARWTRLVGFFTLALVVVGVFTADIFYGQLQEMRAERIAENRPWVSLRVELAGPLTYVAAPGKTGSHWELPLTYTLENHGRTPATQVVFWAHTIPLILRYSAGKEIRGFDWLNEVDSAWGFPELMNTLGIEMGNMMFPAEQHSETFDARGDPQETKTDVQHYGGEFMVIACVSYRSTLSRDFYRTAEIYYLTKKGAGPRIKLSGDDVPFDNLILRHEGIHGSHVD